MKPVISEATVRAHIINYIIGSIAAVAMVACMGTMQFLDEAGAQAAAGQVMACSQHPAECQAFEQAKHASAETNTRQ